MIYLIDPTNINMDKPCKTLCTTDCSILCGTKFCAVKPLYGIDV